MTGKTHKIIGIITGGAAAYYGIKMTGDAVYMLYIISVPAGAMIADIDHDNSKLGSSRKKIMTAVSALLYSLAAAAVSFFLFDGYAKGRFIPAVFTVSLVALPFLILILSSKLSFVKNNLQFAVKHRGIMHTLIMPAFLIFSVHYIDELIFRIFIIGLFIGYITHIAADMLTVRGCPVFFPITKKNIRFMKIKTGTFGEYIAAAVICAGAAALLLSGLIDL